MKIKDTLGKKRSISFEFFPPKTDKGRKKLLETFENLSVFSPSFVSVTYGAGGGNRKDAFETVKILKSLNKTEVLAHLTCIGSKKQEILNLIEEYKKIDIKNILALRGDPPKNDENFDIKRGEFRFAKDLVEFVKSKEDFCIGVAVYPEGHPESPSIEKDIEYTKAKIEAGADFAITQMFFKNSHFYRFMERMGKAGVKIPVIAGIMPVTNFRKIKEFAFFCKAEIPPELEKKFKDIPENSPDEFKAGVEYAIFQIEDLIKNGFKLFHFYTLNRAQAIFEILKEVKP
ncbi:MAG: methylenetetrahydrofolate reductase [NAD(P)H] [Elusimicrobia bacterium]|nr:methylenetetrahydrofolate reductase [NAD(P)H] [Elusimicrobiota bacterium]